MMLFFQSFQKGFVPESAELANVFLKKIFGEDAPVVTQQQVDDMILRQNITSVSNDDGDLARKEAETVTKDGENK
jgi:ABC-type sugar transport system substrate-binding protein